MSRYIDADAYAAEMKVRQDACRELIYAAEAECNEEMYDRNSAKFGVFVEAKLTLDNMPTVDAVPWEFLELYADWFCASVSFPQFIQEAKAFYRSTLAAMDGGFIIADGERRSDD